MITEPLSFPSKTPPQLMRCMEVWGGNTATDNGVAMAGLDAWVHSQPYRGAAGGDVYLMSNCATGRITRLLLADVSGHGQAVSETGVALRRIMRRYLNYIDQSRFVGELNREFNSLSAEGGFATAVAATYWAPTRVLVTCNAGHPRPLWYRARHREWGFLEYDGDADDQQLRNLPLGVIEPTPYRQFGVRLSPDDLVLFYTDSLIEAQSPDGRHFGQQGLLELVRGLDSSDPPTLLAQLVDESRRFRGGTEVQDDETILLIRQNGQQPRLSWRDWFASMGLMLRAMVSHWKHPNDPFPWPEFAAANVGGAMWRRLNNLWGGAPPARDETP